jgi:hypothetical protein
VVAVAPSRAARWESERPSHPGARQAIEDARAGWPTTLEVIERVVAPALEHLGLEWEAGTVALSQIYMGGRLCEDLVNELLPDVFGNLNGIEMRGWDAGRAEAVVKDALARAAPGGGFILADAHGEIPFQVPEDVLDAISGAVHRWGTYPLEWVDEAGG